MNTLTAVLFVGGESRRMGADKATLQIAGEPLWARQLKVLRGVAPEKILISARTKPAWCPPEIETVLDAPSARGPLGGLAAALGKIETTHLLALAVDLPAVNAEFLRRLWARAAPGRGVVPVNGDFFEPLCAIYPASARAQAEACCRREEWALQQFIATLNAADELEIFPVRSAARKYFLNVNTPAEFARQASGEPPLAPQLPVE